MIPKNLVPEGYTAFIAGGYAACPALAADMDVWVSVRPAQATLDEVREQLLAHLADWDFGNFSFTEEMETRQCEGYQGMPGALILKVAKVQVGALTVHLLLTDGDVFSLLESFDISTHQIALTERGAVKGSMWTPITEPPIKLRDTPTTDARMEKIRARYAHPEIINDIWGL